MPAQPQHRRDPGYQPVAAAVLVVAFLLAGAGFSLTQPAPPRGGVYDLPNCAVRPLFGKRVALLIGNNAYTESLKLRQSGADALDVGAELCRLGFTKVRVIIDAETDDFFEGFTWLRQNTPGAELVFFFYSGHGNGYGEKSFMLPINLGRPPTPGRFPGFASDEFRYGISLDWVSTFTKTDDPRTGKLFIFDACRSRGKVDNLVGTAAFNAPGWDTNTLIHYSQLAGKDASESPSGRNSRYTKVFLDRLKMGSAAEDTNTFLVRVGTALNSETGQGQQPQMYGFHPEGVYFLKAANYVGPAPASNVPMAEIGGSAPKAPKFAPNAIAPSGPIGRNGLFPDSDKRSLTLQELESLSPFYVRVAWNEIYARRGYRFKQAFWLEYFSQYPWYTPRYAAGDANSVERQFNAFESGNRDALVARYSVLERQLGLPPRATPVTSGNADRRPPPAASPDSVEPSVPSAASVPPVANAPPAEGTAPDNGFIFPDSDKRIITDAELARLNLRQVEIARNEMYARHGYRFKSKDWQDYFLRKSWYRPRGEVGDQESIFRQFNEYERKNLELFLKREAEFKRAS